MVDLAMKTTRCTGAGVVDLVMLWASSSIGVANIIARFVALEESA